MSYETRTFTAKATEIRKGDRVTYLGQTFYASEVTTTAAGIVMVSVTGSYPQAIADIRDVEIQRVEQVKPYVVYTRKYDRNGNCEKRIHRFVSQKAQSSFMSRTNRTITFHNWVAPTTRGER